MLVGIGRMRGDNMDVLEFVKQRRRICNSTKCTDCPIRTLNESGSCFMLDCVTEKTVKAVEDWAAAHPAKTRQSEFLKQWPNAKLDGDGVLTVCPDAVNKGECFKCDIGKMCAECCREFWLTEVE